MQKIKALLLDADGVIQSMPDNWLSKVEALLLDSPNNSASGTNDIQKPFVEAIFEAEQPCLTGHADFKQNLQQVLDQFNCAASIDDVLDLWFDIEPDSTALKLISRLRKNVTVCLASNQQQLRAHYMATQLGYDELFHHSFYSYTLGVRKPDTEYFKRILNILKLNPEQVLFVDDHRQNISAAKSLGINAQQFDLKDEAAELADLFEHWQVL